MVTDRFTFIFPPKSKSQKKQDHDLVLLLEIVICTYWLLKIETFT